MKSVRRPEVTLFSNAVRQLYSPATTASFPAQLVAALSAVIANCSVTIDDIEIERRYLRKQESPVAMTRMVGSVRGTSDLHVKQISSLITLREFGPINTRSGVGRSAVDQDISIVLPARNHITRLTFGRCGKFSERELKMLNLLSPHIAQAHANADSPRRKKQLVPKRIARERWGAGLTPRETEVLSWVAQGKRNREIGLILNTSSRTIQKQVQSILDKLGVETRCAAAAWWFEHSGVG
jgi:DNA-binding CsgD family transcriptional regulator